MSTANFLQDRVYIDEDDNSNDISSNNTVNENTSNIDKTGNKDGDSISNYPKGSRLRFYIQCVKSMNWDMPYAPTEFVEIC